MSKKHNRPADMQLRTMVAQPAFEAPAEPPVAVQETIAAPVVQTADVLEVAVEAPRVRPSLAELKEAAKNGGYVEVMAVPRKKRGRFAGVPVDRTPRVFPVPRFVEMGDCYMQALADDDRIEVRFVDAPKAV